MLSLHNNLFKKLIAVMVNLCEKNMKKSGCIAVWESCEETVWQQQSPKLSLHEMICNAIVNNKKVVKVKVKTHQFIEVQGWSQRRI